ncbi:MAG: HAMP domain-containing protein [Acidobacteria bacterium]|nr:HAMP domain-containing protein [Acidobacteriota bacterium]
MSILNLTESSVAPSTPTAPDTPVPSAPAGPPPQRPLRDNPIFVLLAIGLLVVALVALVTLADQSAGLSPALLSEVVLYALVAVDLTMLCALGFVLARNVIKLVVERRRALPFARFRAKLVAAMLGLALVPAVLVLIVGSELIRNSASRWFAPPVDDVLAAAREIASDYYQDAQMLTSRQAVRLARLLATAGIDRGDVATIRARVSPEVASGRSTLIEVYRVVPDTDPLEVLPLFEVAAPNVPRDVPRASADRLAARVAAGSADTRVIEPLGSGGELVRSASLVRPLDTMTPVGVVIVSEHLSGSLAQHSRRIIEAYEGYQQLRVLRRPIEGVYLSFFLMMTLFILVSATWLGLYTAKRITRPIGLLAAGAREIGQGNFGYRIEPETADEFGRLVDAFNTMAGELELSRAEVQRKGREVEGRGRYIETILKRIATGVISLDQSGRINTMNSAAARLLGLDQSAVGQMFDDVFARQDLRPLLSIPQGAARTRGGTAGHEITLVRDGRDLHLAVAATPLRDEGASVGTVLVFDDVTPLIRAQRVSAWRDVARRLAHEIKNPLTPIQLSAERLRRHFSAAPPATRELVDECSTNIVGAVESLKGLVDEFSQFARMPAPKAVPSDLHVLLDEALALYAGLPRVTVVREYDAAMPVIRVDPEQFKRVVINLVDNAVEALASERDGLPASAQGTISVQTTWDESHRLARLVVSDNGPGLGVADRSKVFLPYYSTKGRDSGLGLAIVRRVIVEHGGTIEVSDHAPRGAAFTMELPA